MARTQLCLHWKLPDRPQADPSNFAKVLGAAEFATVLFETDPSQALEAEAVLPLIEFAQSKNIAALISGDAQLARSCRADGVHLPWSKAPAAAYAEARDILGNRFIVGVDAGRSRHDAMMLGETGADYIGFGIPVHVEDTQKAIERRLELTSWWADIFEVPVVALDVTTPDAASGLAQCGADFVALRLSERGSPAATADDIRRFAAAIA